MIADEILEMLADDIVSHGLVAQCAIQTFGRAATSADIGQLLKELLAVRKVEIGAATIARPDSVEFVAWRGTVAQRVNRALDAVAAATDEDKEFAYWLCLQQNVDRREPEDNGCSPRPP